MATTEGRTTSAREERIARILRTHRPRSFEEMLGPDPKPGDAEDLEAFLAYLRSRREVVRVPGEGE